MLNLLLKEGIEMAKKVNSRIVVVVSNQEVEERTEEDIKIFTAPKSYPMALDAFSHMEGGEYEGRKKLLDKFIKFSQAGEYISTMLYFRGIEEEEPVVGVICTESINGVIIVDPEGSKIQKTVDECSERIEPRVFRSILNISLDIAHKGREGRTLGTGFVIGDVDEVLKRSTQIVLNPYEGHPEKVRNITEPSTWESVMEFAQLDGIFVVDNQGTIMAAGRYIEVHTKELKLRQGLGGKHLSCAAITRETEAVSIVVSESGDISVYKDGDELIVINTHVF